MSVVIRMQRAGGRNRPFFRVVVADSRAMRDGRFLEKVGYYNPITQPAQVEIDEQRVQYWIDRGATPSDSVATLIKRKRKGWVEPAAKQPAPAPKAEEPKAEEPKEAPAAEEPKAEEPKAEEPKAVPAAEEPKAEEPKADAPEAPAAEAETPRPEGQ